MKLKLSAGVILLLLALLLSACSPTNPIDSYKSLDQKTRKSSTLLGWNHPMTSFIAMPDGWTYYIGEKTEGSKLYKVNFDGSMKEKICDDAVNDFAIDGDWIFYSNPKTKKFYKMKKDGSKRICLSNDLAGQINIVGNWIFYLKVDSDEDWEEGILYRMTVNGSKRQKIVGGEVETLIATDDWIYYTNFYPEGLCKVKADGSEKQTISTDEVDSVNVAGNWIYYANASDDFELYKIRTDGTERQLLNDTTSTSIFVAGDWIYYTEGDDKYPDLYKMKIDGSQKQRFNRDKACAIYNIMGDWIYYSTDTRLQNSAFHIIKTDGTNKQPWKF